jgi:protein-histidine pros-kinase
MAGGAAPDPLGASGLIRRILLGILISSLIIGSGGFYVVLRQRAIETASKDARLLLTATLAVGAYTSEEVAPTVDKLSPGQFSKQAVPFYASKAVFSRFTKIYPDHIFREPALNPTNPDDRPTPYEVELTERFRDNPSLKELQGIRHGMDGTYFYLARPIRVDREECLACHSTPARAPAAMVAEYGTSNGFGWSLHDTVGILELSVPITAELRGTTELAVTLAGGLLVVFFITYFALTTALGSALVMPLRHLAEAADAASRTTDEHITLPESGTKELRQLGGAIARLNLSLRKALRDLSARPPPPSDPEV